MRDLTATLIRYLGTGIEPRSDIDLLAGFLVRNSESDFALLVRRYGPMVWRVCQRALPDRNDAEDAFQATFLVLVQRGKRLLNLPTLGPWLHRVAVWTARNVHRRNARQNARRVALPEHIAISPADRDLAMDLDAALLSLPEKLRSPIILCHLLGYSRAEAAAQLGCGERTLSTWLSSGLQRLRRKLRGLDPEQALALASLAVPAALTDSVVRAAIAVQTTAAALAVTSTTVFQLVEGVMRMFWIKKATTASLALFAVFAMGVGVGVSTHQFGPALGGDEKVAAPQPVAKTATSSDERIDAQIARLEKHLEDARNQQVMASIDDLMLRNQLKEELIRLSKAVDMDKDWASKIEDINDKLKKSKQRLSEAEHQVKKLQEVLKDLREKASKEPQSKGSEQTKKIEAKTPPNTARDLDLEIQRLNAELARLQAATERTIAESQVTQQNFALTQRELRSQIEGTRAYLAVLQAQKQKMPGALDALIQNSKPLSLHLIFGAKDSPWPFLIEEFNESGKPIGTVAFENADVLARYLKRVMNDPKGPKEMRILSQEDTPQKLLHAAFDVCEYSGMKGYIIDKKTAERLPASVPLLWQKKIEKMEGDKTLQLLDEYINSYKAMIEAERQAKLQAEQQRQQAEYAEQIGKLNAVLGAYRVKLDQEKLHREEVEALLNELKAKEAALQKLKDVKEPAKSVELTRPPKP